MVRPSKGGSQIPRSLKIMAKIPRSPKIFGPDPQYYFLLRSPDPQNYFPDPQIPKNSLPRSQIPKNNWARSPDPQNPLEGLNGYQWRKLKYIIIKGSNNLIDIDNEVIVNFFPPFFPSLTLGNVHVRYVRARSWKCCPLCIYDLKVV